ASGVSASSPPTANGNGAAGVPDRGTTSRPPRSSSGGGTGAGTPGLPLPQASAVDPAPGLSPTTSTVPGSALETPLITPATEAITRVRPAGPIASGGPQSGAGGLPFLQGVPDADAGDDSVVEALVSWAKYALALLGLLVLALGAYTILATARARRLERQKQRLMEDVGLLQRALLPVVPARLGALLTTVAYRPADGPGAGGDFYDAFPLGDGRVGVLLGDISGHGRQALAKTALVRFTVHAHLKAGLSPREALALTGRSLDDGLSDDFATVIAAVHDPVKGTLTYASAGHPPPIVVGPQRHRPVTASSAPPIGAGFPTGQRQTVLPMPEGTSVMIYSDGLLEARIDGVPVGPERLAAWLEELGPDASAKAILDRVVTNADRVPDDLAAVLLHAAPGATAPAARIEQLKLDVLDMDGPDLDGFLRAAGVAEADRLIAGRRVSELLATTSGVIVEVRTGEHPMVSVAPIGDDIAVASRASARTH
ncbi:MAG TPA: PP2C family protein-serine/threonine phosphatase, partial [Solirubrobacteraceae bacterium]|nr:PP2C family protein-serine/threonine phosphatase [Solirubrobacteraceae bacterium]